MTPALARKEAWMHGEHSTSGGQKWCEIRSAGTAEVKNQKPKKKADCYRVQEPFARRLFPKKSMMRKVLFSVLACQSKI
jgi:hypothetical protein